MVILPLLTVSRSDSGSSIDGRDKIEWENGDYAPVILLHLTIAYHSVDVSLGALTPSVTYHHLLVGISGILNGNKDQLFRR